MITYSGGVVSTLFQGRCWPYSSGEMLALQLRGDGCWLYSSGEMLALQIWGDAGLQFWGDAGLTRLTIEYFPTSSQHVISGVMLALLNVDISNLITYSGA